MVSRKRGHAEMAAEAQPTEPSKLQKLRNMWQFANLAQYLNLFIDALRIDTDFDIEDLENECLKPQPSAKLAEIGLALLKHVSSHRPLNSETFDEFTRRQYVAKAPSRNPFGTEETPNKFDDFDVFTKIRVLQQLSVWTLKNPNSIREKMNATETEQLNWRVEPLGWDREGRTLFVLDDNRLYRQTDPPPPPPPRAKPKAKKKKTKSTRSSKRRKTETPQPEESGDPEDDGETKLDYEVEDDGLGGAKWECLCVTLEEYQAYMDSIRRSKDPDERDLYQNLESDVMPIIERQAEERAKKEARRMKELEVQMKLATAKRSSRISSRVEKQREAEAAAEAERKRLADIAMAKAEQEKQQKLEKERDSRRMTREQRQREREARRILEEEALRKLKEDEEKLASNAADARISERQLKVERQRREMELQKLKEEEEWVFDCEKCGVYGDSYDDGTHIIACDKCNVWQHSKCHNISPEQADRDDFQFICSCCRRKEEEEKQPKLPPLKLRLNAASPGSESQPHTNGDTSVPPVRRPSSVQIPSVGQSHAPEPETKPQPTHTNPSLLNGPSLSPRGQTVGPPGIQRSEAVYGASYLSSNGSSPVAYRSFSAGQAGRSFTGNGLPTSSPPPFHPPTQPANGSWLNSSRAAHNLSYGGSFSRPGSSAGNGPYSSPVKHSPAASPKPGNGIPAHYNLINSPHSSFPPSSSQQPSFSPTKHSSPPPPVPYMSSPAPLGTPASQPPAQGPSHMLPSPIPAPEKHDGARPISSHSISQTHVFPPARALSPSAKPQNLSPPVKKSSPPAPEKLQFTTDSANGQGHAG